MSTEYACCPKINDELLPELLLRGRKFFIIRDVLNFPSAVVVYVSQTGAKAACAG
jgi:hypothetical protein